MILVTGGSCQGKLDFAFRQLLKTEPDRSLYADGAEDDCEAALERPVVYGLHHYMRRLMKEEKDSGSFLEQLQKGNARIVIIDEIGCGVVPMEERDRRLREEVGRAGQKLAKEAETVYRVICGIGIRIKGQELK